MTEKKPLFGRKVFFVNPDSSVRKNLVTFLRNQEYETYILMDVRRIKACLTLHPDSILYINPKSQLSISAWLNFIHSIRNDAQFSKISIGIACDTLQSPVLSQFKTNQHIDAGIFLINGKGDVAVKMAAARLDTLGARGRRQFVRTKCLLDPMANFLCLHDKRLIRAKLIDISSVSIAVMVDQNDFVSIATCSLSNCTLQFGSDQFQVSAQILTAKQNGDNFIAILMLGGELSSDKRESIRRYVFSMLELTLQNSLSVCKTDDTDYERSSESQSC